MNIVHILVMIAMWFYIILFGTTFILFNFTYWMMFFSNRSYNKNLRKNTDQLEKNREKAKLMYKNVGK
jgi:hypothetical protein